MLTKKHFAKLRRKLNYLWKGHFYEWEINEQVRDDWLAYMDSVETKVFHEYLAELLMVLEDSIENGEDDKFILSIVRKLTELKHKCTI